MKPPLILTVACLLAWTVVLSMPYAAAQRAQTFQVRLAPAPRDTAMRAQIAGRGTVEVTLTDRTLTIDGSFEGLKSPATRARIHRGPATAVRGPAVYTLDVSADSGGGAAGTLMGVIELSDDALAALAAGHLYIQLDSEGAPDGNLWGWLLPAQR